MARQPTFQRDGIAGFHDHSERARPKSVCQASKGALLFGRGKHGELHGGVGVRNVHDQRVCHTAPSSVGEATGTQAQHGYNTGKRAPLVLENLEHSGFIKCVGSETIHSLCITHWKRETRAFSLAGQNTHLLGMRQGFQREDGDLPQQAPLRRASA